MTICFLDDFLHCAIFSILDHSVYHIGHRYLPTPSSIGSKVYLLKANTIHHTSADVTNPQSMSTNHKESVLYVVVQLYLYYTQGTT